MTEVGGMVVGEIHQVKADEAQVVGDERPSQGLEHMLASL